MTKLSYSLSIIFGFLIAPSVFLVAQEEAASNANLREAYVLRPNDVVELSVYEAFPKLSPLRLTAPIKGKLASPVLRMVAILARSGSS